MTVKPEGTLGDFKIANVKNMKNISYFNVNLTAIKTAFIIQCMLTTMQLLEMFVQ